MRQSRCKIPWAQFPGIRMGNSPPEFQGLPLVLYFLALAELVAVDYSSSTQAGSGR